VDLAATVRLTSALCAITATLTMNRLAAANASPPTPGRDAWPTATQSPSVVALLRMGYLHAQRAGQARAVRQPVGPCRVK
jgi:hypothetical protein